MKNQFQKLPVVPLESALNSLSEYVLNSKVIILSTKWQSQKKISCSKNFSDEESVSESGNGTIGISIKFSI
jgi:hypothetical protein